MQPLFSITTISVERFEKPQAGPKVEYEYQDIGLELEKVYGKRIWTLFYMPFATEYKIRKAHEIAQSRGIMTFPYLVGIVKRL